jgi:hypothetical protein
VGCFMIGLVLSVLSRQEFPLLRTKRYSLLLNKWCPLLLDKWVSVSNPTGYDGMQSCRIKEGRQTLMFNLSG